MGGETLESTSQRAEEERYRLVTYYGVTLPPEFKNLVTAPFLNSLRYGNDLYKLIDKDAYFFSYSKYIESLLQRPHSMVKLAILNDMTVLGWCLMENKVVHYIWVKKEVRRQGIGCALLPKTFDTISHITNKGINIWVNHYPNVKFNPFA